MIKRKYIILFVSLTALLGGFVAIAATDAERDVQLRGYIDATQVADLPYRIPLLGVNAELTQYTASELEVQLDMMEQAHVTWVRQHIAWNLVEPVKDTFDWRALDVIFNGLKQHPDLRPVAVLGNTPGWARVEGAIELANTPPANASDFASFAAAFASRYGDQVEFYQIWDEPNLKSGWGNLLPNPVQYTALLSASYRAIHSVDPSSQVLAAGLAPTTESGPENISDIQFLRDLYRLGLNEISDGIAAKPFGFDTSPLLDRTVADQTLNFSRIIALREIMIEQGDGGKALWASGWGWNSLPDNWEGFPSIWRNVSTEQQSAYTLDALNRAAREWPWMGGMILHHWQPAAAPNDPVWGFSVIDQQGQPTSLFHALVDRPQIRVASDGLYPAANPYTRYSGAWAFGDLGADAQTEMNLPQDAQLEFDFYGKAIALLLRQGDYVGYLYPTVDENPPNLPPRDASGNPYVILTSDTREPIVALTGIASGLPQTSHTLRLMVDRGSNQWAVAGFAVSSGNLAEPYERQISVAVLTTVIAAVSFLFALRQINLREVFRPFAVVWASLGDFAQLAISAITSIALMLGLLFTWGDGIPRIFRNEPVVLVAAVASAGLLYLQPWFIITILSLSILFIIFYHRTDIGLVLSLFAAPFFLFPVEIYQFAFPMSEVLILLTTIAWILNQMAAWAKFRQMGIPVHQPNLVPLDYAVMSWAILTLITILWTQYRAPATTDIRVMVMEPLMFYIILRAQPEKLRIHTRLLDSLLLAGVAVAGVGLWMYLRGESVILAEEGARRLASVYGSPNNAALFLGRCIPIALASLLFDLGRMRRVCAVLALFIMTAAVALTQSVGALFIGIPISIGVVIVLAFRKYTLQILTGGTLATATLFIGLSQSERFARALDFSSGTNFFRIRVWQSALNIIHDFPLTGIGQDQFLYLFRGRYIMPDAWPEPNLSHPHNIVLDFWVRLGLGGVFILIWLQAAFWKSIITSYQYLYQKRGRELAVCISTIGCMVNLLAHGMIDNSIYVQDLSYVFILLLGIAANSTNTSAIDEMSRKMV